MLPNEVYFDAFQFCTRIELAKSVSFVSRRFNALAETKMFDEGEHIVKNLILIVKRTKNNDLLEICADKKQPGNVRFIDILKN